LSQIPSFHFSQRRIYTHAFMPRFLTSTRNFIEKPRSYVRLGKRNLRLTLGVWRDLLEARARLLKSALRDLQRVQGVLKHAEFLVQLLLEHRQLLEVQVRQGRQTDHLRLRRRLHGGLLRHPVPGKTRCSRDILRRPRRARRCHQTRTTAERTRCTRSSISTCRNEHQAAPRCKRDKPVISRNA